MAASATLALKAGACVRRVRFVIVAPDPRHSRRSQAGFPLNELSEFGRPPLSAARAAGRQVLPRLLRLSLLPAAVYLLRAASAGSQAAPLGHRWRGRIGGGSRAHHRPDPRSLAAGAHSAARRQRLLSRGADGVV